MIKPSNKPNQELYNEKFKYMKKGWEIKAQEKISHAYELVDTIIWKWHPIKGYLYIQCNTNQNPHLILHTKKKLP